MRYGACVMLLAVVLACCFDSNFAQNTNSPTASVPQNQPVKTDDSDKVYKTVGGGYKVRS